MTINGPIVPKTYTPQLNAAPITPTPLLFGEIVTDSKTGRMWISGLNQANNGLASYMIGPAAFYNSALYGDSVVGFKEGTGSFSGGSNLRLTQLVGVLPGLFSIEVPISFFSPSSISGSPASITLNSGPINVGSSGDFRLTCSAVGNDAFRLTADELVLRTSDGISQDIYEISGTSTSGWTFLHKPLAGNYNTVATIDKDRIYHVGEFRAGTCQNAYLLKGDANGTIASTGLTNSSALLSVDASIGTSWSDILTVSLGSGTWLVTAAMSGACGSTQEDLNARIYDNTGAAFIASMSTHVTHTNEPHGISMTGIVTLAASATISLGAKVSSGTGTAYAASEGTGSKSTTLTAVRIA